MGDAVAVILLRCADLGRAYWGWTIQEWTEVIGPDQVAFRDRAPGWADDAVRPYLVPHAYLLAGFTEFHRLGSFSRLTLAWRVFGHDRVQDQLSRLRAVLAGWGYRLGSDDDQLLPMVAAPFRRLSRSPRGPGHSSAPPRTVDVDGRDAATDPCDHRQGGLTGGVRLAVDGPGRHVHEVARAGVEVPVVALELEAQHAAHDVQARLVALVVVPSRDRARLGLDLAGPQQRQLEGQGTVHAERRVGRNQVGRREDPHGPR
jgi:hypothetical protein